MRVEGASDSEPVFESSIRENRRLMEQMADRERWDVDPKWMRGTKVALHVLMYMITFAVVAFALFTIGSGLLGS
ncbi:MAG: hypothetical protein ACR2N2_05425 [Acidimicrobiia bacterium]